MIQKTNIAGNDGLLYMGDKKGVFAFRSKGKMPNQATFDKIVVCEVYKGKGGATLSRKTVSKTDKEKGRTIASASFDIENLPELIQVLTMLAMETGGVMVKAGDQDLVEHQDIDEVEQLIREHGGKIPG